MHNICILIDVIEYSKWHFNVNLFCSSYTVVLLHHCLDEERRRSRRFYVANVIRFGIEISQRQERHKKQQLQHKVSNGAVKVRVLYISKDDVDDDTHYDVHKHTHTYGTETIPRIEFTIHLILSFPFIC